jgi:Tol biopolymer transport system component
VPPDPAFFAISPDGAHVAYLRRAAQGGGLWQMDMSGVTSKLTLNTPDGARPIWSSDGAALFFTTTSPVGLKLMRRDVTGRSGEQTVGEVPMPDRVAASPGNFYANDWSRDGRTALISASQPDTGRDILAFSADTGGATPFVVAERFQVQPRFSPDGHWVAYASNENGTWDVFVQPFPAGGSRQQISNGGGAQPIWRRDGRELFYAAPDGTLMSVAVTPGERWVPANAQALFTTRMRPLYAPYPYTYDVSPDGQRFLVSEVTPNTGPIISIVTNWRDYLK